MLVNHEPQLEATTSANHTGAKQRAGTCIWSGDITRLRDVLELTVIFDKIATWAVTMFHSWISSRVLQWMALFPKIPADEEDDGQLEDLSIRVGKLRISRTNSFRVNGSSKSAAETATSNGPD